MDAKHLLNRLQLVFLKYVYIFKDRVKKKQITKLKLELVHSILESSICWLKNINN